MTKEEINRDEWAWQMRMSGKYKVERVSRSLSTELFKVEGPLEVDGVPLTDRQLINLANGSAGHFGGSVSRSGNNEALVRVHTD